jgi:hypothetical protein
MAFAVAGMLVFLGISSRQHNQGYALFAAFWVVPGLVSLLLVLGSISRAKNGAGVAWAVSALPLFAVVALLSLGLAFTSGTDSSGSPIVEPASPAYWLPFLLFLAGIITTLACVRSPLRIALRQ